MSTLQITKFANVRDAAGELRKAEWSALVARLKNPMTHASKGAMPLFSMVEFEGTRSTANARRCYGVIGEHDAGTVSVDEAACRARAAGLRCLIYTSPRHLPEHPKWRIVCPLSGPISPAEYPALVDTLNGILGGCMPVEAWDVAHQWFYGVTAEGAPHYRCELIEGGETLAEIWMFGDVTPIGKPGPKAAPAPVERSDDVLARVNDQTVADLRDALRHVSSDERSIWISVGQALHSLGEPGYALWQEWSQRSAAYNPEDDRSRWDGFTGDRTDYRAVFAKAQAAGWKNPGAHDKVSAPEAFEALQAEAPDRRRMPPGFVDMTDSGNAALFARTAAGDLRYVLERKEWIHWDGLAWDTDHGLVAVTKCMHAVAGHWSKLAEKTAEAEAADDAARKPLLKAADAFQSFSKRTRGKPAIDSALALAVREPGILVRAAELDTDRALLGVANGVVDLRAGELVDVGRDRLVTRRSPVAFDPAATCPRFERFVSEITAGASGARQPLATYLQRCIGYWATGEVREQKLFVLNGAGSNGKSVLADTLGDIMGSYYATPPAAILLESKTLGSAEGPSPFARMLAGCRVGVTSETKEGARLDPAVVKAHTGSAQMTARGMRENAFTFDVTHKLVLMTNALPAIDALDAALRGRLHIVPFDRRWNRPGLPEEERDPSLPDGDKGLIPALKAEAAGILAWIVRGAAAYYRHGLEPPQEVSAATLGYFDQQDAIGQWLVTMERCEPREGTQPAVLHRQFLDWCQMRGQRPGKCTTPHGFGRALDRMGVESVRVGSDSKRLRGLR